MIFLVLMYFSGFFSRLAWGLLGMGVEVKVAISHPLARKVFCNELQYPR